MFTINIYLRFALIGITLIGGIILSILFGFWYAFPLILAGLILLAGYFLLGTIQSAGIKMQAMDLVGAEKQLALTYFPNLLFKPNRAYYYMLKGTLALQAKRHDEAIEQLEIAKGLELATDNDKATVDLQLANLYATKGKWPLAKKLYKDIQSYSVTEPQIRSQIQEFGKALKQSGNMRSVGNKRAMGQMNVGGKRRRPKMR